MRVETLQGDAMRKMLILMLCCLTTVIIAGDYPVDRGVLAIGGDLYFEKGFGTGYDYSSVAVAPQLHWFLFPRFSLGADIHLEFRDDGSEQYSNFAGYLMASYYLGRRSGTIFPFFSAGVGGGKWEMGAKDYRYFGVKAAAGITFMFNQYIGLRTLASYTVDNIKPAVGGPDLDGGRIRIGAGVVLHLY